MDLFHPVIQKWFSEKYGAPTEIQKMSWPRIAAGEHLLITAPTGSGKTLTAFLWALNRFATGDLKTGSTRVLYISPLKALNNDIQRNLLEPLAELKGLFDDTEGVEFPAVQVATRSGDTEPRARRRMLRQPPEILITTPESLNLLLSSLSGQSLLHDIDTLILDEIHSVIDSKRGVYLMAAVERIVPMSGEFQRIALSATVNPLTEVAQFIAGYTRQGNNFQARTVHTLASTAEKRYAITVRYPQKTATDPLQKTATDPLQKTATDPLQKTATALEDDKGREGIWDALVTDLLTHIHQNQSTLIFVNSRALCEKLTFKINNSTRRTLAWAHHGSLSREIRAEVESRLKNGRLEAIVATSSLEMGIDIGALDEVILIQSPGSIASTIQRIGRAGHQVGTVSRCTFYPTHPKECIEAAVLAAAVIDRDLEPVRMVTGPLDVLAQVIISMTGTSVWDIDELFMELRRSTPCHGLTRREYDLVLNMLAGRYADHHPDNSAEHHIRELKPRVRIDRQSNRIEARRGALLSLYLSGGVIPDRGYFQLRHEADNARIGELDEEFVWEARVGQMFSLGTQVWQVKKITHNDVIVGPGKPGAIPPPFWRAEPVSRSFHYSERIGRFLEHANKHLDDETFREELLTTHHAEPEVADEIIRFLQRQKEHCNADLPHRRHILIEKIRTGPAGAPGHQLVIHNGWGAEVNRPFAMALEAGWQARYGEQPEVFVTNESIVIQLPHELDARRLFELAPAEQLDTLLRARLEGSGFFGARFRENAGRSLLLSKGRFNQRKPLWMSRLQSQKLMESVLKYEDFPILLETWRTCLHDEFDLPHLRQLLAELDAGDITVTEVETASPSPFAASVAGQQINTYMYMTDTPKSKQASNLRDDLMREVVFSPGLRPRLPAKLILAFIRRQHRLAPGYPPQDEQDLVDWIRDRSMIPADEWEDLLGRLEFEVSTDALSGMTRRISHNGAVLIVAPDDAAGFARMLAGGDTSPDNKTPLETLLENWLQYYGPLTASDIATKTGVSESQLHTPLQRLAEDGGIITGQLVEGDDSVCWCDATNYEYLLRALRSEARVDVEPRPIEALTGFMYAWQSSFTTSDPVDQTFEAIEKLRGLPLPAALWETEVLPARIRNYSTRWLDILFGEGELHWVGVSRAAMKSTGKGEQSVTFCFREDMELIAPETHQADTISDLIPDLQARYDFGSLLDKTGLTAAELADKLWRAVWQGLISNDSIATLRQGIRNKFRASSLTDAGQSRTRRGSFNRWRGTAPFGGNWYRLPTAEGSLKSAAEGSFKKTAEGSLKSTAEGSSKNTVEQQPDLLAQEELSRDRVRLMLDRYGILFRELCAREAQALKWQSLFRALRLMELSGEVVSGYFFRGIPGPQFMTPASLRFFQQQDPQATLFWINACDPVSPCGLGLTSRNKLPRRVASNHLVFHGSKLVLTSCRSGESLNILVTADVPALKDYLLVIHHLCYRSFLPKRGGFRIDEINGEPAMTSPYLEVLKKHFNVSRDHKSVIIQRELQPPVAFDSSPGLAAESARDR